MSNICNLLKLLCRPALAGGTDLLESYQRAFVEIIVGKGPLPSLAFWRGRVALWTLLKAAGVASEDDEVILPAYTCEMVPTAVRFTSGRCVFVDVERGGLNPSVQQIANAVSERTRAIVIQHTYGMVQSVRELKSLLAGRRVTLIEDCCQFVANSYFQDNTAVSDAAFFSTQWSKPFSTGLGGMAVFFNNDLYNASRKLLATFPTERNRKRARSLAAQVLLHKLTVHPRTEALIARIYRWMQRAGLVQGTTSPEEYSDNMPSDYLEGAVNVQAVLGILELSKWEENISHRRMLTKYYLSSLSEMGVNISHLKPGSDKFALWAIPLFVENADEIRGRAAKAGLPVARWFMRPPIHLTPSAAERYNYRMGQCPVSEWMVSREIHLLTTPSVTLRRAEAAVNLIKKYARRTNC